MASKIIDGFVYDEMFARRLGSVYYEIPATGNLPNCKTCRVKTTLYRCQRFKDPESPVLERFKKGYVSFDIAEGVTEDDDRYFIVHENGYEDRETRFYAVDRRKAFEWACENMSVTDTIAEFPDLVSGTSYAVEVEKASKAYEEHGDGVDSQP